LEFTLLVEKNQSIGVKESKRGLHIAMIMDGNRRYAVKKGLPKVIGHEFGAESFSKIVSSLKSLDLVNEFSLYTFSVQNFNRSDKEISYIMDLFRKFFKKENSRLEDEKIRIRFLGRLDMFPKDIQKMCAEAEERTKNFTDYTVNFCFGYGGREEIVDAVKNIASKIKDGELSVDDIDEETISSNLYSNSEPDIVIRTGGDFRTSNFLPWQTIYSEWFFLDVLWPEFTVDDLKKCISDFNSRERRFGR
jgi:undecaprenyl diphosphate synthase